MGVIFRPGVVSACFIYYPYINLQKLTIPDLRHSFRLFNLLVTVTPFITQVKCCEGF